MHLLQQNQKGNLPSVRLVNLDSLLNRLNPNQQSILKLLSKNLIQMKVAIQPLLILSALLEMSYPNYFLEKKLKC